MTDIKPTGDEPVDQLREEAAMWFARMRGDNAAEHQAGFEAWLALGAAHRSAYNRIGAIFSGAKVLKDQRIDQQGGATKRRRSPALIAITAALAAVPLAMWITHPGRGRSVALQPMSVGHQTIESRQLPNGGTVILDVDARLTMGVAGNPAVLRVESGRVRFDLAPAVPAQQVLAGNAEILATKASFDLWLRRDGTLDANSFAGDFRLRPAVMIPSPSSPRWIRIRAGQHVRVGADGHVKALPSRASADWPHGLAEYRGVPLVDVLEEANRYSPVKITLADPGLGDRRISGRFRLGDPPALARKLAATLGLVVDANLPGQLVLTPSKKISRLP